MSDSNARASGHAEVRPEKALTPQAQRALAEAAARRREREARAQDEAAVPEFQGRDGPEPVRYGDWEVKGIATDF